MKQNGCGVLLLIRHVDSARPMGHCMHASLARQARCKGIPL